MHIHKSWGTRVAVYVDNARVKWRGHEWCHLVADSIQELHDFAFALGLRRAWFQGAASYPHYDVTLQTRARALELGATVGGRKEIIACAKKLKAELERLGQVMQAQQLSLFHFGEFPNHDATTTASAAYG